MADREVERQRIQVLETLSMLALVALLAGILAGYRFLIWAAVILLVLTLFLPAAASCLTKIWLKFSAVTSRISNAIILSLLFYLVLTPIALIYRIFHKDPLNLDPGRPGSFYVERNHTYAKSDLQKMW